MPKMSIADAAEHFNISKEAIHNRIRRGSLKCEVIDGEKYVDITSTSHAKSKKTSAPKQIQTNENDERYYKLLSTQNQQLQERIAELEKETRMLRDQKEMMLIEERKKIEQIYKEKDEQLKNILNAISSKFMLEAPVQEEEHFEAEIEEVNSHAKLISLNRYLKEREFSKKKREKIKAKFEKNYKKDKKIFKIKKKFYLDLDKYDYSEYSL